MNTNTSANKSRPAEKGERQANGIVHNVMAVYSYAFMGDAKNQFSGGQPGDETNNRYLAVASLVYPAAQAGDDDWQRK